MRNGPDSFNSDGGRLITNFAKSWGTLGSIVIPKKKVRSNYRDLEIAAIVVRMPNMNPDGFGLKMLSTVQLTMCDSNWNNKLLDACRPHWQQFKQDYSKYMDSDDRTVEEYDWYEGEFYHPGLDEIMLNFVKKGREEGSILITTDPNPEVKFSRLTDDKVTIIPACNDVFIGRLKAAYN